MVGGEVMKGEKLERWKELCQRAEVEQDPEELLKLCLEINQILEEKEERLRAARNGERPNPI